MDEALPEPKDQPTVPEDMVLSRFDLRDTVGL